MSAPSSYDDALELLRRAKDVGLPEPERSAALGRLLAHYERRLLRIVRLRLGARLRSSLESGDIVQETFLRAVAAFDDFEPRGEAELLSWLARIAERAILAEVDRRRAAKRAVEPQTLTDAPAARPGPGTQVAERERHEILENCIAQLPEAQREVVIWRDYLGASWEEVARALDRPSPDAARMLHAKALITLGKLMRRHGVREG